MNVHEFEINEIEFSSYLLGMRMDILLEPAIDILIDDLIIMFETDNQTGKRKDKHLLYRIDSMDRNYGSYNEFIFWKIYLKRLINYDKLKEVLSKCEKIVI